jgi:hypothetical protein
MRLKIKRGIKVPRVKTAVALIEFQKSGDLRR